jgi:DNA polymerase-3 subunit delta'
VSTVPSRPKGHDVVLARLEALATRAGESGAASGIPHALLFVGPSAVGKYAAALWWARCFKCESRGACEPVCAQCKRIAAGSHPDVTTLAPEVAGKAIGIDPVRDLIRLMSLRSMSAGPRLAIVRDAHRLTVEAQSALLKLLEEPPGAAVIMLVTENPAALLPTVRSRCQTLRFGAVPADAIASILRDAGRDEPAAARAAALALGSVGRALALSPDAISDRDALIRAVEALDPSDPQCLEDLAAELVERRKEERAGLEELLAWTLARIEAAFGHLPPAESAELAPLLAATVPGDASRLLERAERVHWTLDALARNANAKLAIRDLLLDLEAR